MEKTIPSLREMLEADLRAEKKECLSMKRDLMHNLVDQVFLVVCLDYLHKDERK